MRLIGLLGSNLSIVQRVDAWHLHRRVGCSVELHLLQQPVDEHRGDAAVLMALNMARGVS